jgi:hypothetical protein
MPFAAKKGSEPPLDQPLTRRPRSATGRVLVRQNPMRAQSRAPWFRPNRPAMPPLILKDECNRRKYNSMCLGERDKGSYKVLLMPDWPPGQSQRRTRILGNFRKMAGPHDERWSSTTLRSSCSIPVGSSLRSMRCRAVTARPIGHLDC